MSNYTLEEVRKLKVTWTTRMENWQKSGLSGAAWCRQNEVNYRQFIYWKSRIVEGDQKFNPHSFIELDDHSESSGIEIVLSGISIRLSRDFDSSTLLRCIRALEETKC